MDHPIDDSDEVSMKERDRILGAALDEFRIRGIDNFSMDGVADRAGVDPGLITRYWHDWRVLLMDAQLTRARRQIPTPDNGNIREDLHAYADSLVEVANTSQGRRWFHRNLPNGLDTDLTEVRSDFWNIRFSELVPILLQAAERGEIRDDVDPLDVMRAFSAALYYDVIFADSPVRPDFAEQVIAIFLRGISRGDEG